MNDLEEFVWLAVGQVCSPQKPLSACITGPDVQNQGSLIHERNLAS
jgi:hypothetical protein